VFPEGLKVDPKTYVHLKTRVCLPRLYILDIYLVGLSARGGPGHLLSEMLYPWYVPFEDKKRLCYIQHTLDLTGRHTLARETKKLAKIGEHAVK
jgi:hypothetical protein